MALSWRWRHHGVNQQTVKYGNEKAAAAAARITKWQRIAA